MPRFAHNDVEITFLDQGVGEPVLLIHGFASNKEVNWVYPSWVATLTRASKRTIALDNRGHGQSTKLYDPDDYHTDCMVGDAVALLDYLGLEHVDVMGYSLGAQIAAFLAASHGARVRSLVLGGLASRLIEGRGDKANVARALEAPSLADVADPVGRQFRAFAEQTGSDLRALAACIRGSRQVLSSEHAQAIAMPTLIAVGTEDEVAGSPDTLAQLLPAAAVLPIPGRNHMLAVGDKVFKAGVLKFWGEQA
jgi:pimeloyl-ACP methyl ester carboxylesterase